MSNSPMSRTSDKRQQGLTLVEIMIALTISLVLLAGVMKVFANSKNTYRVQESLSRVQENGRYATEFLSRDIRMTDFWGCAPGLTAITNHLNPGGAGFIDFVNGGGIGGADGATDTLTLRGAFGAGLPLQAVFGPQTASDLTVAANNPLQQGNLVLVSDCLVGDIFQISNATPSAGTIVHDASGGTLPGNQNVGACVGVGASPQCLTKVYQGDASLYRIRDVVYSIANGVSGQPALFRNIDQAGAVELVEGVEDMQVLYGEDTSGDGAPDAYVNAGAVTNMANVISIRVILTLVSLEDNVTLQAGNNDNRLRRTFTATVAIRNRLS